MQYSELIEQLFSRHRSVASDGFTTDSYKPGLERMEAFDVISGRPSGAFRSIHVAGTNGKGSVSHMLASALASQGFRTGLFTSPHLLDFRERMRIVTDDGFCMISEEEVRDFLETYMPEADRLGLTFFEITTGMAFWWFARREVDFAVVETGLGGRLDSTNIIVPELSVITSIGLDHCELLGPDRGSIAFEKAGIFKPGVPALAGQKDAETSAVFEVRAAELGCRLEYAPESVVPADFPVGQMDLRGSYQHENLRTVLCALRILGVDADYAALLNTASRTGLRGRWETICNRPLIICDIGHNPPALEWNFAQLRRMAPPDRIIIVYGVMADKDLDSILPMMPEGAMYVFVTPRTPRAMPSEAILARARAYSSAFDGAAAFPDVESGMRFACSRAGAGTVIYIGGSNYVVADALAAGPALTTDEI